MHASSANAPATITVSIPTFNRRALLERAVGSVLAERRVPIRLSVFDNASTDGTEALMAALCARDERVEYVRNDTNIGGPANIIKGLSAIETAYFVPLADDDYLLPDFLYEAHAVLEADTDLGAAIFYTEARDEAGTLHETWPQHRDRITLGKRQPGDHLAEWMTHSHYAWSSILWRSSVLPFIGAPYMHVGLPSDVDFQAQIFSTFPVFLVDKPGAVFTLHAGQASHTFDISHLPSWASMFARLDERAGRTALFDHAEYRRLRDIMWRRYRSVWTIPSKASLSKRDRARIAATAGLRLGDWQLAFTIADELGGPVAGEAGARIFHLPSRAMPDATDMVVGDRRDLLVAAMRWFKHSIDDERVLAARLTAATERGAALEAEVSRHAVDIDRLAEDAAAWRARAEAAERKLAALERHALVRWLRKLGLMRQVGRDEA